MQSASTSPLTARKPAFGSSASRRPAISTVGRPVRRAISRAPTMVSHGPASTSPPRISTMPGTKART